ncbi:maltose permease MAL61 [Xylariales sp. PMI_506]|nr:maltose permease MAL61 [Xylariales sp. PMI_506]
MSGDTTILEMIKTNRKVIMYSVLMTAGPLMYGFDIISVGTITAMPAFVKSYGELYHGSYIIPSIWLSLWNAMVQVGCMVGSILNGPLADRFGRKVSFIVGGLIGVASVGIIYASDEATGLNQRRGIFLAGKTLLGVSMGMLNSTCQTYISEIAPPKLRGPLLSIFTFSTVTGQIIAVTSIFARISMTTSSAYRVIFAAQWALAGFAVVAGLLIPESPIHLVKQGKVEKACKSYKQLHGAESVDLGMRQLATTLENEDHHNQLISETSYKDIFIGTNWRRTRIIFYANLLQQCLGVSLLSNSGYFLELAGMSATKSLMILQISISLGLPANVASWFAMNTLGRRAILLFSTASVGLLWLGIGVAGCWPSSPQALWFIGVMLIIIHLFYGIGVGGAYPVVSAEASSLRLRAKSQGFGFLINGFWSWAFNFFTPYMFNADEANMGGKVGFFFFGLCVIGCVLIYLEIPETKNRSYADLDEMFEKRLPTRQFLTYECENSVEQPAYEKGMDA